ncbi:energy transducer TonB [Hymenobacter edaphi]|uniref:TonB C-terminal domain-containing protein n=1 Tax=Hymenobacter edaphi TaxID=2211146 RepID=A0A328BE39_9BACT|nr:energy transducer TonB [Hymenobacter edaphi]RAK65217.1 hypothetical protein DLM85_16915 [Hymenobacter edaphi]
MLIRLFIPLLGLMLCGGRVSAQHALKPGRNKYERGTLRDKRPVGRWDYFDEHGQPELTFDYDSSRIVFARPDTARYWLQTTSGWQLLRPARAPRLLGSFAHDMAQLARGLRYPPQSLLGGREGRVVISFVVGPDGQTRNFLIEQSLAPDCDQEVWRALSQHFYAWIPAVHLGQPVAAKYYLLATFRIGDSPAPVKPLPQPQAPGYGHCLGEVVVTGNVHLQAR